MAPGAPRSSHFVLHQLGEGVYAAIATIGGWAICNSGIVDMGDSTLVFDTFVNQKAAAELKSAAEQLTGKPVSIVMNSHWHSDHVKGNQAFPEARVVATEKTREVMAGMKKRYDTGADAIRRDLEKDLESILAGPENPDRALNEGYDRAHLDGLPTLRYTLPNETFLDSVDFHGTARSAEGVTYGGGHTVSDSFLYLPEEGVLFLGDLLFTETHPYLCDGDPKELLRILDKVEALGARKLVPGHGPVGSPKDITPIRDYVNFLEKTVADVRASGGGYSEAIKKSIPSSFGSWRWLGFYRDNLEFLFKSVNEPS